MDAVAEYFDRRAFEWDARHEATRADEAARRAVARLAGVAEGNRVLDLGCGTGVMVPAYLGLGAARVLGVDAAPGMIAVAREKFAARQGVSFVVGDAGLLKTGERFDIAVIYNAYPHFSDPDALAATVAGLLDPAETGGRFLVAHSKGREALNAHHANVPGDVCRDLGPAETEAGPWLRFFDMDTLVDTPHFYCFGGALKRELGESAVS